MLDVYFGNKVGQKIIKKVVTGERFFTRVYERVYLIEVIGIQEGRLFVEVNSYDKTPSGFKEGSSDNYFGEVEIELSNYNSKSDVIFDIINKVDRRFMNEYKIKAI